MNEQKNPSQNPTPQKNDPAAAALKEKETSTMDSNTSKKPQESMLASLLFNLVIPIGILSKLSGEDRLGPMWALIVAIAFPVVYTAVDFAKRREYSMISILGFINVLLTGGLGLMKVEGIWFAVKEAAVPAFIGLAVFSSLRKEQPLTYALLFNDKLFDVGKIKELIHAGNHEPEFKNIMRNATLLLSCSFFLSSILNFILGITVIQSPTGTPAFNEELAKMQMLSFPVIVLPSMVFMYYALYRLYKGLNRLTGLTFEGMMAPQTKKK